MLYSALLVPSSTYSVLNSPSATLFSNRDDQPGMALATALPLPQLHQLHQLQHDSDSDLSELII